MPSTRATGSWYPAEDAPATLKRVGAARKQNPMKLRASITPGTVLIILAGRFQGKRVVFLKQLESGLLLVSGPYKVNGVPLRRVNQAFVIATSTKIDVSSVNVPAEITDAYFARSKTAKQDGTVETAETGTGAVVPKAYLEKRKADQAAVDGALMAAVEKVELMKEYLGSKFSLSKYDRPHLMKF
mmetsp:Transcript_12182/g.24295  ORF Transcript_12182/g.24295 Transcript_12182/m.24295 type:complete len:185 (+) Transcript_12182:116-670(+)